jgi:drug/metabolite transporter (DMT)-like permease
MDRPLPPAPPAAAPAASAGPATAPVAAGWTELSLALMVLIWGVNFAVVKRALEVFDPLGFNALRYLIASLFVFLVLRVRGPIGLPRRRDVPRVLVLGVVGNFIYQMAFILGLNLTRAGNASLMLALVPVFVLVAGLRARQRHGRRAWAGAALSVLGVALVSGSALHLEGVATLVGDLILIGAAAVWTAYTVGSQPLIQRYGSVRTTAWTLWIGAVGLLLAGLPALRAQPWGRVDAVAWGGLLFSSLFSIGLAYLIWYRGVERLGGARTAIFSNLTPVVALLTGALWLGERLTLFSVLGAAMVIGGVMLVRRRR